MQRFLQVMAMRDGAEAADFEFVLVAGHFLMRDENVFTLFEGKSLNVPDHPHGMSINATVQPLSRYPMLLCTCGPALPVFLPAS